MTHRPLRIAFYTEGLPFDGRPIESQSLGGSESALWFMARALAARGHAVTVFNLCDQPGVYEGVTYRPAREAMSLGGGIECDLWIVSRFYPALGAPIRANLRWLWLHDVPGGDAKNQLGFMGAFADQVMPLSDYHEGLVRGVDLGKGTEAPIGMRPAAWKAAMDGLLWQTRNGVDLELIRRHAGKSRKNPKRLLFASRPERGLDFLVGELWPRLRAIEPELELHVASYDTSRLGHLAPELRAWYGSLDALMARAGGITNHGSLTKQGFYALLGTCQLLLAPTRFPEVSCIAALEAMAAGVPVVATHDFALPETIPYGGIAVEGDALPPDPAYVRAFVDRTVALLRDEVGYWRLADQGREHVAQRHQWKDIAQEWEARAYAVFDARVAIRGRRICQNLIYQSAVVAAHRMAQAEGYADLEVEAGAMLANHHADPDDYDRAGAAQRAGWDQPNSRWAFMAAQIPAVPPEAGRVRVLDVGTGAGGFLGTVLSTRPELDAVGVDFSPALIAQAKAFLVEQGWEGRGAAHVVDAERALVSPDGSQFEVVCAGEVLEHMADPVAFIGKLEAACRPGGTIILSVPAGPWESASFYTTPTLAVNRPHIQDFRFADLQVLFGQKEGIRIQHVPASATARNEPLGWWIVAYTHRPGRATGKLDYAARWWTERPYERVALTMIVKNGANDIRRCLESVIGQVDEIVIALDDATTDNTREILREFEGRYWPTLKVIDFTFEDFSQARNVALTAVEDADWILWMDADETMHGARHLRNYLQGCFYEGFGIEQHHLTIDFGQANMRPDRPIRLFRAGRGYRFHGLIHEDPGLGLNEEIQPALILPDVRVLHHGYIEEELRRQKAAVRNLPLTRQDGVRHPERQKGPFLLAREYMNIALWRTERQGGRLDEQGLQYMREACAVYLEHYAKPTDPFHEPAFEVYQRALQLLAAHGQEVVPGWGLPFQVDYICRGRRGGGVVPGTMPDPIMRWFARPAELYTFLSDQADAIVPALEPLAGLTRRTTVLAARTAQAANGEAAPPSHAHDAAQASDTSCKDAHGCGHEGNAAAEAVPVSG